MENSIPPSSTCSLLLPNAHRPLETTVLGVYHGSTQARVPFRKRVIPGRHYYPLIHVPKALAVFDRLSRSLAISVVRALLKTAQNPFPLEENRPEKACHKSCPKMGGIALTGLKNRKLLYDCTRTHISHVSSRHVVTSKWI